MHASSLDVLPGQSVFVVIVVGLHVTEVVEMAV